MTVAAGAMSSLLTKPTRFAHGLHITKQPVHAGDQTTIGDLTGTYFDTGDQWAALCAVLDAGDTPFRSK
jgi:hypothetical protein